MVVTCAACEIEMLFDNLKRHVERVHPGMGVDWFDLCVEGDA